MKSKYVLCWLIIITLMVSLVGCGGGSSSGSSSSSSVTGIFIDSAVTGLNYTCSSGSSGVTNTAGEFSCPNNDTIEFFLGSYSLGSCAVAEIITPYDLYPDNEIAAVNVAQLLQTVDDDNDPSNGITIPEGFSALDESDILITSVDFDRDIIAALGLSLITETTAKAHLDASHREHLVLVLAGRTFYTTIDGEPGTQEKWVFSDDAKSLTWTEMAGGSGESGSVNLTHDGMSFTMGSTTITVDEVTDSYLDISGTTQDLLFIDPVGPILAGKTFYRLMGQDMEEWSFNTTATSFTWTEMLRDGSPTSWTSVNTGSGSSSVTLNGMSFTVIGSEGSATLTVDEVSAVSGYEVLDYASVQLSAGNIHQQAYDYVSSAMNSDRMFYYLDISGTTQDILYYDWTASQAYYVLGLSATDPAWFL